MVTFKFKTNKFTCINKCTKNMKSYYKITTIKVQVNYLVNGCNTYATEEREYNLIISMCRVITNGHPVNYRHQPTAHCFTIIFTNLQTFEYSTMNL